MIKNVILILLRVVGFHSLFRDHSSLRDLRLLLQGRRACGPSTCTDFITNYGIIIGVDWGRTRCRYRRIFVVEGLDCSPLIALQG